MKPIKAEAPVAVDNSFEVEYYNNTDYIFVICNNNCYIAQC